LHEDCDRDSDWDKSGQDKADQRARDDDGLLHLRSTEATMFESKLVAPPGFLGINHHVNGWPLSHYEYRHWHCAATVDYKYHSLTIALWQHGPAA